MTSWQIVRESLGAFGTVLGGWALIRTYLQSRPCLRLKQQRRWGVRYEGFNGHTRLIADISVLVCNARPASNAVVDWWAELRLLTGNVMEVPVPTGASQLYMGGPSVDFGVIPLIVGGGVAVQARLCLLAIPKDTPLPLNITLTATDVFSKKYRLNCVLDERQDV